MVDNVRKYKLCVTEAISHGIGTSGTTKICNLMDPFTVSSNGSCSYSQLTTGQLSRLSFPKFEKRVEDFLKYTNIESLECREKLLEESSYYDPNFDFTCKLNSEFLVYKFFDGVRIINVGEATGIIQYKAYIFGENSEDYNWETSPTFLGLNSNEIYVFEIRDYYEGEELCKVTKTIPLNTLVQSTTQAPKDVQVFMESSTCNSYCDTIYNCGNIFVQPNLTIGERVQIDFELNSEGSANGTSCAEIYCEKGGVQSPQLVCGLNSNSLSPQTGSLIFCQNDVIKYNLMTTNSNPGDCSCSYIKLNGVDGFDSINPSIDVGKCCISISDIVPVTDLVIFLEEHSVTTCENRGEVVIAPEIPSGKFVDVDFLTTAYACLGATSQVKLKCCCSGGIWTNVFNSSNTNPQPQSTTIRMHKDDRLCYTIIADATDSGSCAEATIEITNTTSSCGINTSINYDYYTDFILNEIMPTTVTVSVCRQNLFDSEKCQRANGFINVSPSLSGMQNVLIDIHSLVLCMGLNYSDSCAEIFCKPAGSSSFTEILSFDGVNYDTSTYPQTGAVVYRAGDQMCYNIYAEAFCEGGVAQSDIVLDDVVGNNGIDAYLNNTTSKRYHEVYGLYPDQYGNTCKTPIGIGNIS